MSQWPYASRPIADDENQCALETFLNKTNFPFFLFQYLSWISRIKATHYQCTPGGCFHWVSATQRHGRPLPHSPPASPPSGREPHRTLDLKRNCLLLLGWFFVAFFNVQATSTVISRLVKVHTHDDFYNAAPLGNQTVSIHDLISNSVTLCMLQVGWLHF